MKKLLYIALVLLLGIGAYFLTIDKMPESPDIFGNTVEGVFTTAAATTTLNYLTSATSTATITMNTAGMNQIDLSLFLTSSSTSAESGITFYLESSENGDDWYRRHPQNLSELVATTTPSTQIGSTQPVITWFPESASATKVFRFEDINSSMTRITFGMASSTLNTAFWGQAVLER